MSQHQHGCQGDQLSAAPLVDDLTAKERIHGNNYLEQRNEKWHVTLDVFGRYDKHPDAAQAGNAPKTKPQSAINMTAPVVWAAKIGGRTVLVPIISATSSRV